MDWYVLIILSAVFLSFYEVIRKRILKKEHSLELLAVTFLSVFIVLLFTIPFISLKVDWLTLMMIFVRSIVLAISLLLLTRAMHHMEISNVAPIKNLTPLFLLFLSVVFLSERVSFFQIIGIFLIVVGSYLLQIHDHYLDFFRHLKELKNKYFFYALSAAALMSICAMLSKVILTTTPVMTYMFYTYLFASAYFVLSLFIHYDGWHDIKMGVLQGSYFIPILVVLALATDILYFKAIAMPAALISLVIPIRRLSTLVTCILGGRMFHDHFLFHKIMSAIILIIGASLVILG